MPKKKESSPRQSTKASKTLQNPRASALARSLAGTVLSLDVTKGQKPRRRRQHK